MGRTLARLLRENEIEPTIIELNIDTVRRLDADGVRAVYGDATHRETLEQAGLGGRGRPHPQRSSMHGSGEAIRLARELNPKILIFARSGYLRELRPFARPGPTSSSRARAKWPWR